MTIRRPGDPPPPGSCKIKIRSNGDQTHVLAVDDLGVEREVLGAVAVSWKHELGNHPTACLRVAEAEVEVDAEGVAVHPV